MRSSWERRAVFSVNHGLPVVAGVDVAVVGGGAAGVAAAETAARHGMRVLLIERYGFFGGAALGGVSGSICGMYLASEQHRKRPAEQAYTRHKPFS